MKERMSRRSFIKRTLAASVSMGLVRVASAENKPISIREKVRYLMAETDTNYVGSAVLSTDGEVTEVTNEFYLKREDIDKVPEKKLARALPQLERSFEEEKGFAVDYSKAV
jgi:hypothetical protein